MGHLIDLYRDCRRVVSAAPDLLVVAAVAALAFIVGRYLRLDFGRIEPALRPLAGYAVRSLVYLLLPLLSLPVLRLRLKDVGFGLPKPGCAARDAGLLFLLLLPALVWAAFQPGFQRVYPYFVAGRWDAKVFVAGLVVRLVGMFCWEFILRGYLLFGFERRVGPAAAVAVQLIPFAVLHFGKPLAETLGSIVAGVVLGVVALRNRSFLPGAVLHFAVAATLDVLALAVARLPSA